MIAGLTRVFRLRKVYAHSLGDHERVLKVVGSFEALVWDPTAVHEVMQRTKRHPILAMLARGR